MKNQAAIFLLAVQFLTRLPVPTTDLFTPERMTATTRYYPVVGFMIGGLCAAIFWIAALLFPTVLSLIIAVSVGVLITGAFHEDGLADTFDGIGGGRDKEHALHIMKDSRLGTYGTLALIMILTVKLASLSLMPAAWIVAVLIVGHGVSRLSSVIVIATSNYARQEGTAKPVADGISRASLIIAATSGALGLTALAWRLPFEAVVCATIGLVIGHILMRLLFERKLAGYTGDALGAVQQVSEIGFYLGLVAWVS